MKTSLTGAPESARSPRSLRIPMLLEGRLTPALLVLLLAAYSLVLVVFSPLPLQDYPNHLARALAMADLMFHHGARFGQYFTYHFLFVPYVLPDLALASLVAVLGVTAASALFAVATFLSLPFALWIYLRVLRAPRDVMLLTLLLSLYLSTDQFFLMGFMTFRLSVACILVALALLEKLRETFSVPLYLSFCGVVLVGYLVHLTAPLFLLAAMSVTALLRLYQHRSRLEQEIPFFLPVAALLLWHFIGAASYRQPNDLVSELYRWGSGRSKLEGLFYEVHRYTKLYDALLGVLLLLCIIWPLRHVRERSAFARPGVLEMWLLAVTFFGIYVVLPSTYRDAALVDVRAMAFVLLFGMLALFRMLDWSPRARALDGSAVALSVLLVVLNLAYLTRHLARDAHWLTHYRAFIASLPTGGKVLPVDTVRKEGKLEPFLHAASFLLIDRGILTPYLFSGDTGAPMKYFRYRHHSYVPDDDWYTDPAAGGTLRAGVDWGTIAREYQYILITKPYDAARLHLATSPVTDNDAAAFLAINGP